MRSTGASPVRRADLVAGLTVGVVLLPQAVAYAHLAGIPPANGVVAAGLAALLGAAAGSSAALQTGPTALAALLTIGVLGGLAEPATGPYVALAAALAVLVGLLRLLMGLVRWGRLSFVLSSPVVQGLATGAGVLIIASQLPAVFSVASDERNPLVGGAKVLVEPQAWDGASLLVAAVTLAVFVVVGQLRPGWPHALLAILAGVGAGQALGDVATVEAIAITDVQAFDLSGLGSLWSLLVPAAVLALVGLSEASAIARRYATLDRVRWDPNRELLGQGLASVASGLVGGPPSSGSFSRSALNRLAGARTRRSGMITGALVLAFTPGLTLLRFVPTAALAAVVMAAGASLIETAPLRRYWEHTRLQFGVAAGTVGATLVLAPRIDLGLLVGIVLALGAHVFREQQLHVHTRAQGTVLHVSLYGVLFFASAPTIGERLSIELSDHPDVDRVVLHCDGLGRVDVTGALAIEELVGELGEGGIEVELVNVPPPAEKVLRRIVGNVHPLGGEGG